MLSHGGKRNQHLASIAPTPGYLSFRETFHHSGTVVQLPGIGGHVGADPLLLSSHSLYALPLFAQCPQCDRLFSSRRRLNLHLALINCAEASRPTESTVGPDDLRSPAPAVESRLDAIASLTAATVAGTIDSTGITDVSLTPVGAGRTQHATIGRAVLASETNLSAISALQTSVGTAGRSASAA